jgi:hypothetical protein
MSHLKKTLAASAIALFFTFGAFAVSLAYEATPVGPFFAAEFQHVLTTGKGPLHTGLVSSSLQFETAYLPEVSRPCSEADKTAHIGLMELRRLFHAARIYPPKVSLQILKSALLL